MQKYINQLVSDIYNARKSSDNCEIQSESYDNFGEDNLFDEVQAFIDFDDTVGPTFSDHCGLKKEMFPVFEKLSEEQALEIANAMKEMLKSWRILIDMPPKILLKNKYNAYVDILDERVLIVEEGQIDWSICESDPTNCILAEDCTCKSYEEEYEDQLLEAEEWLLSFMSSIVEEFISEGISIDVNQSEFDPNHLFILSEYLGAPSDNVPHYISQFGNIANELFLMLKRIFIHHQEYVDLFSHSDFWLKYNALNDLLSLKISVLDDYGSIILENHYIEDGTIYTGIEKKYTPEEFITGLEKGEIAVDEEDEDFFDSNFFPDDLDF